VKLLDCFAMTDHVDVAGEQGNVTFTDTAVEAPGGVARSRSAIVLPSRVAVPTGGAPTEIGVNPAGSVRFADPSCCVAVSFVKVAVNVAVEPAGTVPGAITTAYGLLAVSASAGTTNSVSNTTAASEVGTSHLDERDRGMGPPVEGLGDGVCGSFRHDPGEVNSPSG
jgi:hypothetical protein